MNSEANSGLDRRISHSSDIEDSLEPQDVNLDSIKQSISNDDKFSCEDVRVNTHSSIDSLVRDDMTDSNSRPQTPSDDNDERQELSPLLNIPPLNTEGMNGRTSGMSAAPSGSSTGGSAFSSRGSHSRQRSQASRDTDSDNNRSQIDGHPTTGAEYHSNTLNFNRPLQGLDQNGVESYPMENHPAHGCAGCHDMQQGHFDQPHYAPTHMHSTRPSGNSYCALNRQPTTIGHYARSYIPSHTTMSQPHSYALTEQTPSSCYHPQAAVRYPSGVGPSYEPPWDLAYPSISKLEALHHSHSEPQQHALPRDVCQNSHCGTHRSQPHGPHPHTCHPHRNSIHESQPLVATPNSLHQLTMSNNQTGSGVRPGCAHQMQGPPTMSNRSDTLATTTGSHSYETPWDLPPDRVLAFWQAQDDRVTLQLGSRGYPDPSVGSQTLPTNRSLKKLRHAPPPSSPPPPPPEGALRRPLLHYDGQRLAHANLHPNLPEKKRMSKCNWRCISIFLMFAIIALAACVAAFTVLLMKKENTTPNSTKIGAGMTAVTDSNIEDRHRSEILPYDQVKVRFKVPNNQFFKFNMTVNDNAIIGVYGRRGQQPTHTQFDFFKVISGPDIAALKAKNQRKKRSTDSTQLSDVFSQYLESGFWYMSFYNDGPEKQNVRFVAARHDVMDTSCPSDCYGRGDCKEGVCKCYDGYRGVDCKTKQCPVLCDGNGVYTAGICRCFDGWKGDDCSVQAHHCESCKNGLCDEHGICICPDGWTGMSCDQIACPHPTCNGHGLCSDGKCYCENGYRGLDCSVNEAVNFTIACANDCSNHGVFDTQQQKCNCEPGWNGKNCQNKECSLPCENGDCIDGTCVCYPSWEGNMCTVKLCDPRCSLHGACENGTCRCNAGYNGKFCTLVGCKNGCYGNGACVLTEDIYSCNCNDGWSGLMCEVAKELDCQDELDNDEDGLRDCSDPDCCSTSTCSHQTTCKVAPDPQNVLINTQLTGQESFYDTYKFLIMNSNPIQNVGDNVLQPSHVSVIRGRVLLQDGSPALGTRVEIQGNLLNGFTLTQQNGRFDMMVNGGGSITVKASKSLMQATQTVTVPWNSIVTVDDIVLTRNGIIMVSCSVQHNRLQVYPQILPTWQHTQLGACAHVPSAVIPESQELKETHEITGTNINMVYRSSKTRGFMSFILLRLTQEQIPDNLNLVHLRIAIDGVVFEEKFEAEANLTYKYAWDRRNLYQQNVMGVVAAAVSVGYEYSECSKVFWHKQQTTISGFMGGDSSTQYVAQGWSFDIFHHYNPSKGILHLGDGTNIYLKEQPPTIHPMLEDLTVSDPFSNLQSVVSDIYGNLFVADGNVVKRITADRSVIEPVVELDSTYTRFAERYWRRRTVHYLAASPRDGTIYISDNIKYQILEIIHPRPTDTYQKLSNVKIISGTPDTKCSQGNGDRCGDGGLATNALLTVPRGIAVHQNGDIYFIDDRTIRVIYYNNKTIDTVLGDHSLNAGLPCGRPAKLYEVFLTFATSLSFNPIDDTLYIVDQGSKLVLKLTTESEVLIVAGRPNSCHNLVNSFSQESLISERSVQRQNATAVTLTSVKSATFSPSGDLYIVEDNGGDIKRVRVITPDGYINSFSGRQAECSCTAESCPCGVNSNGQSAAAAVFGSISSITFSSDGVLYLTDSITNIIYNITTVLPKQEEEGRKSVYKIDSPDQRQTFIFNQFGQHRQTIDKLTGTYLYNFTVWPPSGNSQLTSIKSSFSGLKLEIQRNERGIPNQFLLSYPSQLGSRSRSNVTLAQLTVTEDKKLTKFTDLNGLTSEYTYDLNTGLITSKQTSRGENYLFDYDNSGRLVNIITPIGERIQLRDTVDKSGVKIEIQRDEQVVRTATYNGRSLELKSDGQMNSTRMIYSRDGSVITEYGDSGLIVSLSSSTSYRTSDGYLIRRKLISSTNTAPFHTLEWRYIMDENSETVRKVRTLQTNREPNSKQLIINNQHVLKIEYQQYLYDQLIKQWTGWEKVYATNAAGERTLLLQTIRTSDGLPLSVTFGPSGNRASKIEYEYTSSGLLHSVKHGNITTTVIYTDQNQIYTYSNTLTPTRVTRFRYSEDGQSQTSPISIILPNGVQYTLDYDELGNLIEISTPEAYKHTFRRHVQLGFIRNVYSTSENNAQDSDRPFIVDLNAANQPISILFPSKLRSVHYRYSVYDKPTEIIFDRQSIVYEYSDSSLNTFITLHHDLYKAVLSNRYNGSLLNQATVTLQQKRNAIQMGNIDLNYKYNSLLQPVEITGYITNNGQSYALQLSYAYSPFTGQMTSISDFVVSHQLYPTGIYSPYSRVVILTDGKITLRKLYNSDLLLTQVEMKIDTNIVYKSYIKYSSRKIVNWNSEIDSYRQNIVYGYSSAGLVDEVRVNEGRIHSYQYNAQGSLTEVIVGGQSWPIRDNKREQVTSYKGDNYQYDEDGFMSSKSNVKYSFNSRGQLTSVLENGRTDVTYLYDPLGRLLIRRNNFGETMQFIYANVDSREPSHVYNFNTRALVHFIRDEEGALIALDINGVRYYAVTDHSKTPVAVYTEKDGLIKRLDYSVYGEVLDDTKPSFSLHIGFQGGYYDATTQLVYLSGRWYDPKLGRYLDSDMTSIFNRMKDFISDPMSINRYQLFQPIRSPDTSLAPLFNNDLSDWLMMLGYKLPVLMPDVKSQLQTRDSAHLLPVVSAFQCAYNRDMSRLYDLSIVPRSQFINNQHLQPQIRASSVDSALDNLLLEKSSGEILAHLYDNIPRTDKLVFTKIINESRTTNLNYTNNGRVNYYFINPDSSRLRDDMTSIGLQRSGTMITESGLKLQHESSNGNYITITSELMQITIRYGRGESLSELYVNERDRVLNKIVLEAVDLAWRREQKIVVNGLRSRYHWTSSHINEIRNTGRVSSYTYQPIKSTDSYPELASDPNNIVFVPR